jgi:hypothetical protein
MRGLAGHQHVELNASESQLRLSNDCILEDDMVKYFVPVPIPSHHMSPIPILTHPEILSDSEISNDNQKI